MCDIFKAYRTGLFGNARAAVDHHRKVLEVFKKHSSSPVKGARILDLGCGQTAIQTALFKADGAEPIGVDVEIPTFKMGLTTFLRIVKANGLERAVKSAVRHVLFDRRYFADVARLYGKPLDLDSLDIRLEDATCLNFPESHFDYVYSVCVFEHINDVPAAVRELNRTLKPGGVALVRIHLFASPSGGHNPEWLRPNVKPSKRVPPWDHIRESRYPANAFLNRLKLEQFRSIFGKHLTILEEELSHEGEALLSDKILEEVRQKGYTRGDLTTRTVTFVTTKGS